MKNNFIYLSLIEIFLFCSCLPNLNTGPFGIGLPSESKPFTSKYGYEFQLPQTWFADDGFPRGSHLIDVISLAGVAGRGFPYLEIFQNEQKGLDLEEFTNWLTANYQNDGEDIYKVSILEKNAKFSGQILNFFYDTPDFSGSNIIITCKAWIFAMNGSNWAIVLCSRASDWNLLNPMFENLINSFHFIE